jgi:DNA mismatch endonuclease (patch repair protein)
MRGNRRSGTRAERAIRGQLHLLGLRYRVDLKLGEGRSAPRPDIVFTRPKVAVFVDGCFWHGCPEHGTTPRTNTEYWAAKVRRNRVRDLRNEHALVSEGWEVVRVWEHEDPGAAARRIGAVVLGDAAWTLRLALMGESLVGGESCNTRE